MDIGNNIILLGAPGSGKGTQSKLLIEEFGYIHISPGELLREEIKNETTLGNKIKDLINNGLYAPNEDVITIVKNKIETHKDDLFIFDGFPRTLIQAEALSDIITYSIVINIEVEKDEIIKRLLNRAKILNREDDNENIINKRLEIYQKESSSLLKYYENELININGNRPEIEIYNEIKLNLK